MAAQKRSTRTKVESTRHHGQAIAIGMLAHMERATDKDGYRLADLCALQHLPAGREQENIVLRYLLAIRSHNDPELEAGFCSILSACLAEGTLGFWVGAKVMQLITNIRPAPLEALAPKRRSKSKRAPVAGYGPFECSIGAVPRSTLRAQARKEAT